MELIIRGATLQASSERPAKKVVCPSRCPGHIPQNIGAYAGFLHSRPRVHFGLQDAVIVILVNLGKANPGGCLEF